MAPPAQFPSQLAASFYLHPSPDPQWAALRDAVVKQAIAMGYEEATMTERHIQWLEDQDPFGHVTNSQFSQFVNAHGIRVFQSFEAQLGKEKAEDMMRAKGIGLMTGDMSVRIRRAVMYPDSLLLATRVFDVRADRYRGTTRIWSMHTQEVVCDATTQMFFVDYNSGKRADLIKLGGEYAELQKDLAYRAQRCREKAEAWEREHPDETKSTSREQKL